MTKILSAKKFIKAELNEAKKAYELARLRVESLKHALVELDSVEAIATGGAAKISKLDGLSSKQKKGPANTKKASAGKMELPSTRGDYWFNFVTGKPQTAAEISKAAIEALGFIPNEEQAQKLKQRVTPALNALTSAKRIKDSGVGRERRFTRK